MKIGTHAGKFHPDEVFAIAALFFLYPDAQIVRTRDEAVLATCDIRVDAGRKSDPETGDFDHHQPGGAGQRKNGIKYSSFGLVWKHFGAQITGGDKSATYVDNMLVQSIDADDNAQRLNLPEPQFQSAQEMSLTGAFSLLNPYWSEDGDWDAAFMEAVQFAQVILRRVIVRAQNAHRARELVRPAIARAEDPRIIVLERSYPWQDVVIKEAPKALLVVFLNDEGIWTVQCVPTHVRSKECRRRLPDSWSNKNREALVVYTGVADVLFVHNALFICTAKSREGAIALAKLALSE